MKRWKEWIYVLIGISPAVGALLLYNRLPDTMASHFDVHNEVNGTMDKNMMIALLAVLGFIPLLMRLTRRIDPRRANYSKFPVAFEVSRVAATVIVAAAGWMALSYNLGYELDFRRWIMVLVGIMFLVLGNYLTQVKPNYMFGIRTPWTLANEEVWRRTHRVGGPCMMIGGALIIGSAIFSGTAAVVIFIAALIITCLIPVGYSYWIFAKLKS